MLNYAHFQINMGPKRWRDIASHDTLTHLELNCQGRISAATLEYIINKLKNVKKLLLW